MVRVHVFTSRLLEVKTFFVSALWFRYAMALATMESCAYLDSGARTLLNHAGAGLHPCCVVVLCPT